MFSSLLGIDNHSATNKHSIPNATLNPHVFKSTYIDSAQPDMLTQSDQLAPDYTPTSTRTRNNIVIINSQDRNWYSYPQDTPYNFLVKLGGSPTDSSLTVSHTYKNILSFSIDKIVLPNRVCQNLYTSTIATRPSDLPYLTAVIDGINFSSYGTNRNLNETIGIFTPLTPLPSSAPDTSYLEYKNANAQTKEYFPIPEGTLSNLKFHLNSPNGTAISNINDVLSVFSIFTNNSNIATLSSTDYLIVQTNEYFTNNDFRTNDLIQFKNYVYHNPSFDESSIFNNYINNTTGNYIIGISKSNPDTVLYNQIQIQIPASLSTVTGNLAVDAWYTNFLTKTFSNVAIQDTSGKLINTSTQSHLLLNIKTLEKNSTNMFLKDLV